MGNLVDKTVALDELGLDDEDFAEFIVDLREFTDEALPQLSEAVKSRDFNQIKEKAHAIKGALANLHFVKAAEVAYYLENAGRNSDATGIDEKVSELSEVLVQSYDELS